MPEVVLEDRVETQMLFLKEADTAALKKRIARFAKSSRVPRDAKRWAPYDNIYLVPMTANLRMFVRYDPDKIVIEDIISQQILDRWREQAAS